MTAIRSVAAAVLAGAVLIAAACTSMSSGVVPTSVGPKTTPPAPTSPDPSPSPVATGSGSAMAALHTLCTLPKLTAGPPARQHGPVPPFVQIVERIAAAHRGLDFLHDVPVSVDTDAELDARLGSILDASISEDQLARRTRAWRTIGVIPPEADLSDAIHTYYRGRVLGFYVPETGELVSIGSDADPSLVDGVVLAHELTHALDDQHFGLVRVDRLSATCRDELSAAALGAVEGSAQFFAISAIPDLRPVATGTNPAGGGGNLEGVPPFVQALEQWPYAAGTAFIRHRYEQGGTSAVDQVIRHLPVSTEQILHPQRYPNDTPQPLDVPDLSSALGPGWRDLDVMEIGEAWLQMALALRIHGPVLGRATPGWDGSIYRAWTDGRGTAVLLRTVWDTPADAAEFAQAMRQWIGEGSGRDAVVPWGRVGVDVAFASDSPTLEALVAAVD
jgi:hypothetical protein